MRKSRMALALASAFPLALTFTFTGAVPAFAQTADSTNTQVRKLGVVTIRGGQPTSLPTQIPTTIEGVTREQIEHSINATDSEDALKYLPSLLVRKRYIGNYNHAVLSTRASGTGNPARSMVFADGILLSNYLGNGPTDAPRWMLVTPEEIERVDVLYGPFSAAYAGNSVGAVVDYVTRMPSQFEAHGKISYQHQPFDLYGTNATYAGKQVSASVGNRDGDCSWFLDFNKTDGEGQPLTFPTRLVSAGTVGNAGSLVTGAVLGNNRSNQPWYLLGTATQYHTQQDHIKAKIAHDFSPTVRATYTFGWWHNESEGRPASYLRDAQGNAVYSGTVNINGRSFARARTSTCPTQTSRTSCTACRSRAAPRACLTGKWPPACTTTRPTPCAPLPWRRLPRSTVGQGASSTARARAGTPWGGRKTPGRSRHNGRPCWAPAPSAGASATARPATLPPRSATPSAARPPSRPRPP